MANVGGCWDEWHRSSASEVSTDDGTAKKQQLFLVRICLFYGYLQDCLASHLNTGVCVGPGVNSVKLLIDSRILSLYYVYLMVSMHAAH